MDMLPDVTGVLAESPSPKPRLRALELLVVSVVEVVRQGLVVVVAVELGEVTRGKK
jgi:hypothetical protein